MSVVRLSILTVIALFGILNSVVDAAPHSTNQATRPRVYRYLPSPDGLSILEFRVTSTGKQIPLSPPSILCKQGVDEVIVSPDRRAVYVPEEDYFGVSQYGVRRNGTLKALVPYEVQADAHPAGISFDPSGRHAYVSCSHGDICQYNVRNDGSLSALNPLYVCVSSDGGRDPSLVKFIRGGKRASVVVEDETNGDTVDQFLYIFKALPGGQLVECSRTVVRHFK